MERLPNELMCKIFLLVTQPSLPFTHAGYYLRHSPLVKLSRLMMVSKDWQLMIKSTPCLWTHLSSSDPLLVTTKAASLSKTAPLHIKCLGSRSYPDLSTCLFMDLVTSHVQRWRTGVFKNVPKALLPNESQQQKALLLESLVLIMDLPNSTQNPFGGGHLPRLKYLYCEGVGLRWSGGLLSGLSSLTIDTKRLQNITELDLANILINNPLLTELRIDQPHSPPEDPYPSSFPILHRPHLKKIKLNLSGPLSYLVLRHVHAPICSKFCYSVQDGWEGSLEHLVRFFLYTLSSASTRPRSRPRVTIIPEDNSLELTMKFDSEDSIAHATFSISLKGIDSARLLTWVVDHLLPSTNVDLAVTLWLVGGFPFETETQLRGFLQKLPRATDLDISSESIADILFDLLSAALENGAAVDGNSSFLLPGMKEMTIFALDCDWNGFLRMLEERTRSVEGISSPAPLKLRLVQLELDQDVRRRIVDLVGQENVTEVDSCTEDDSESEIFLEY